MAIWEWVLQSLVGDPTLRLTTRNWQKPWQESSRERKPIHRIPALPSPSGSPARQLKPPCAPSSPPPLQALGVVGGWDWRGTLGLGGPECPISPAPSPLDPAAAVTARPGWRGRWRPGAGRSRCRCYLHLRGGRGGGTEGGRGGGGEPRRREIGSPSPRARPARRVGNRAHGFRKARRSDKCIPGAWGAASTARTARSSSTAVQRARGRPAGKVRHPLLLLPRPARSGGERRRAAGSAAGARAAEPMSGGG